MLEGSELAAEPVPELDEAVVGDVLRRAVRLGPDEPLLTALDGTGAEDVIAAHPAVARAAVVGVADPRCGELVVGFVVAVPGAAVDTDELTAHCRERLIPFKVPRRWHVLDELPLTASSKVQWAELRKRATAT